MRNRRPSSFQLIVNRLQSPALKKKALIIIFIGALCFIVFSSFFAIHLSDVDEHEQKRRSDIFRERRRNRGNAVAEQLTANVDTVKNFKFELFPAENQFDKLVSIEKVPIEETLRYRTKIGHYRYPPPLPMPTHIILVRNQESFYEDVWWNSAPLVDIPSLSESGKSFVMNTIYMPAVHTITVFLLTYAYLEKKRGLHVQANYRNPETPETYKHLEQTMTKDYKSLDPPLACVFFYENKDELNPYAHESFMEGGNKNDHDDDDQLNDPQNVVEFFVAKADYIPNNTTKDRFVNHASEILRCAIPDHKLSEQFITTFVLTQNWALLSQCMDAGANNNCAHLSMSNPDHIHIKLSFDLQSRSAVKLLTNDKPYVKKNIKNEHKYERLLTLCMPPMSEPMPFITENIAHHLLIGVEHIYIGTAFKWDKMAEYQEILMKRIKPFFDDGKVTVWPHEYPFLQFTDKAKSHWLNQCLYYAKYRDRFVLSLDADEFVMMHDIEKFIVGHASMLSMGDDTNEHTDDEHARYRSELQQILPRRLKARAQEHEFCWLTFASFQMWQLTDPHSPYMIGRFSGRESKSQYTWSKVIWNTEVLWYTGYHAGGSCNANNRAWYLDVNDWRAQTDPALVYRWNDEREGRVWHYYNCRYIRIEPKDPRKRDPWSNTVNDSTMSGIYLPLIVEELTKRAVIDTYPNNDYDVMFDQYYIDHYGAGMSQLSWH